MKPRIDGIKEVDSSILLQDASTKLLWSDCKSEGERLDNLQLLAFDRQYIEPGSLRPKIVPAWRNDCFQQRGANPVEPRVSAVRESRPHVAGRGTDAGREWIRANDRRATAYDQDAARLGDICPAASWRHPCVRGARLDRTEPPAFVRRDVYYRFSI
jgi:hypothetical protein